MPDFIEEPGISMPFGAVKATWYVGIDTPGPFTDENSALSAASKLAKANPGKPALVFETVAAVMPGDGTFDLKVIR